jgi:hypothetical protein
MKVRIVLTGGLVLLVAATWLTAFFAAPAQAIDAPGPGEVVRVFYADYVEAIGAGEARSNPLVERTFRESELLSAELIVEVDGYLDAPSTGLADPFLLAHDVPVSVVVGRTSLFGNRAEVVVEMFWGGNPAPSERLVTLKRLAGRWQIADVAL